MSIDPRRRSRRAGSRHEAPLVLQGAAGPYGFTVTLWASSALLVDAHGYPGRLQIAAFAAGALLGFAITGLLLGRSPTAWPVAARWSLVRAMHLGPVLAAVLSVALASIALTALPAWGVGAFLATSAYFAGVCLEHRLGI